jgi:hypothetical protein
MAESYIFVVQVIFTFCVYSYTSFPSVSGGDSGELAAIACSGAVAHPPGYPLWLMLARISLKASVTGSSWLNRQPPEAAFVLNIMSALLSSIAGGVLMITVRKFARSLLYTSSVDSTVRVATLIGAVVTGSLYSFSGGIWEFSTQVRGLNLEFFARLLVLSP